LSQLLLTIVLATVLSIAFIGLALLPALRRQASQATAAVTATPEELMQGDAPVVLYLRPFSITAGADPVSRVYRAVTDLVSPLEVAWIQRLRDEGPVVSIAFPGERSLRHYGLIRAQCPPRDWAPYIQRWMARAELVVILVAPVRSVAWQIALLIRQGWLERAVFIVNEEYDDVVQSLKFLRRELRGHGESLDPEQGANCVIGFDASRQLHCMRENLGYGEARHSEALARLLVARKSSGSS